MMKNILLTIAAAALFAGCQSSRQIRDSEYAQVAHAAHQAWYASDPAFVTDPEYPHLEGPQLALLCIE